jgi:hypothetical protein
VFDKLKSLKRKIKTILPTDVVGFVTNPTSSFAKYRGSKSDKEQRSLLPTDEQLQIDQNKIDKELILLNTDNKLENSRQQSGLLKGCFTASWHTIFSKQSIRKRRCGSRKLIRNNFANLYDDLYATHSLKKQWHKQLFKCVDTEVELIRKYNLKSTKIEVTVTK